MRRCSNCGSTEIRTIPSRALAERCLDCGTLSHRSDYSAAWSRDLAVRSGVSPLHVFLAALRELQDKHGAIVEDVDVGTQGGSFVLKVPMPDDELEDTDARRSHAADADQ